ncbi:LutC/YkgG family protein [Embleya scabrispora]|uniref:LutC/YkgG family protein n=1 Tax=Embleya scabrispora TaxID=159449 RepID=UPI00035C3149|nr:lactate utilization protein C [Embleya scabrispora]MYS80708.1 lactate utilization protein C [Streptomyces sp. SID5474]
MSSREVILNRVRRALTDVPRDEVFPVPRDYARAHVVEGVLELFAEHLRDYRAVVHEVAESELADAIAEAVVRRGARRVVTPAGLPPAWTAGLAAATCVPDGWVYGPIDDLSDDPTNNRPKPAAPHLTIAELDAADGVLTGAAVGIAETGTIVLDAGPGQGRRALTLVPDWHLCVVRAEHVVASVPQALERLVPGRPLTWISGPSATSDIELDRVEGVHGPRTLEVLIVRRPPVV